VHDFLANDYFAVSPFESPELTQLFYLRLHPFHWRRVTAETQGVYALSQLSRPRSCAAD